MKLSSIQSLRAIAVLLVVYTHSIDLQMQFAVSRQQQFFHLQDFGAIGVDLFFVISGFIITFIGNKYIGAEQGFHFLVKRFWRINPAYYLASLLYWGIYTIQSRLIPEEVQMSFQTTLNALYETLLIIPVSGYYPPSAPLLYIGWSLSFEWLFYLLFLLLIVSRVKYKAVSLVFIITGLVILGYFMRVLDYRLIFITNPIMLEFLLGVMICWIYLRVKSLPHIVAMLLLLLGIAGYVALILTGFGIISELEQVLSSNASMRRFLLWGLPSAALAAGCIFLEGNKVFNYIINNRWMQLMGDASYSIYLVHLSVFSLLTIIYYRIGFFMPADLAVMLQVLIGATAGIGFYVLVERPLLKKTYRNYIPHFIKM